jgi:hypothetical protein
MVNTVSGERDSVCCKKELSALLYVHMVNSGYKAGVHKFYKCVETMLKLLSP